MPTSHEKNEIGTLTFDSLSKELGVIWQDKSFKIPFSMPTNEFKLITTHYMERECARNNFNWLVEMILNQVENAKDLDEAKYFCSKMRDVIKQILQEIDPNS